MRKLLAFAVAVCVVIGAAAVYADGGGCGGMTKSSSKGSCCGDMFSKLNLTPEQKVKIEALKVDCQRATSTSEMHQIFGSGLEKILTPEQLAQWKAHSDRAVKSGGCPYSNGARTDKT
jgi:Spy/CpxP family protein refolding chaperone